MSDNLKNKKSFSEKNSNTSNNLGKIEHETKKAQYSLYTIVGAHGMLEKAKSLRLFAELQEARKKFYSNEYNFLNLGGGHEFNFQQQLEQAQKDYETRYRKLKRIEHVIDKNRNVMMQGVSTYQDLLSVALWEIDEYDLDTMCSFPIFSFGRGNGDPLINCDIAQKFIRHLSSNYGNPDIRIFNQIPYLDMHLPDDITISQDLKAKFDNFYIPLLKSGKIKKLCMMPGWQNAPGCVTEHDIAKQEGIEIAYPKAYPGMGVKYR